MQERMATFPSLLNSGVSVSNPELEAAAQGGGRTVNVPFWKDITDQDDEIQVENAGPANDLGVTAGLQIAPIQRRQTKNSATALSGAIATGNPEAGIVNIIESVVARRLKQRQKILLSLLRGAFGGLGANAAAAPLSACRIEAFDENGNDATAEQIFSADQFISGKALLSELADDLQAGAMWIHPNVRAALERADKGSFKDGVESGLPFKISTYRGVPIFASESLVRAGTGNGYVYETYLLAKGIIGRGEKPQVMGTNADPAIGDATFNFNPDVDLNNQRIYDRTCFLMHLNYMKYVAATASDSPTHVELYTPASWTLQAQSAPRVGAVLIRTNG
jgi:hypothetical protein